MNEQSIQKQYNQIVNLLEDKRLKEALVQLDAFLYNGNDWSCLLYTSDAADD